MTHWTFQYLVVAVHEIVETNDGHKPYGERGEEPGEEEREGRWWLWGEREQRTSEGFIGAGHEARDRSARWFAPQSPFSSVVSAPQYLEALLRFTLRRGFYILPETATWAVVVWVVSVASSTGYRSCSRYR